ncbi:MAG: rhamnogalacturonan acetylesterase [Fibrobacteria bacterium]|nr:rhamnogalacturonan acetylesterase [Fibrobacteria bacterium]
MNKALGWSILALSALVLARAQAVQRIVVIGDSTVSSYAGSKYPWAGWGQVLVHFFRSGSVEVINDAIGGRSSRSFIEDGHWATTLGKLRSGDILMVQFGHNDRDFSKAERYTDTADYKKYLAQYAREARAKGAHPVFVTPMNMNTWKGSAVREVFTEGANNYRAAMIHAAADAKVPVLDLEKKSKLLMDSCGVAYMAKFQFLGLDPEEYPNYPEGYSDFTHFQEMGALANARMLTEEIARQSQDTILKILAPLLAPTFAVTVRSALPGGDTITRSTRLPEGATVTVKVKPAKGKTFLHWLDESGAIRTGDKRLTYVQDDSDHLFLAVYQGVPVDVERPTPDRLRTRREGNRIRLEGDGILGEVVVRDALGVPRRRFYGSKKILDMDLMDLPAGGYQVSSQGHSATARFVVP